MSSYPVIFGLSDEYQKDCKGRSLGVLAVGLSVLQFICVLTVQLWIDGKSELVQIVCLGQDTVCYRGSGREEGSRAKQSA